MNHSRWLRLYAEAYRDPKVCRLSDRMFRFWVNCLCLAAENEGLLPTHTDMAFYLRLAPTKVLENLIELKQAGLLDETVEKRFTPHNWNERQYDSDDAALRMRRHRQKKRDERERNERYVTRASLSRTRTDTDTDTEQISSSSVTQNVTESVTQTQKVVEFPKSSEFIESSFPGTGDRLIRQIAQLALQEVISAGEQPELVTDEVLLKALRECTRKKQYSAALYLETVPAWMKYMATHE